MDNYQKAYDQLNPEQRKAVDTIDGPLQVLAGPGTGKTQLLSARVANILLSTDTDPSNIVCLTFTVNAANNMRERLRNMIGVSANHVVIKTFHSLAADIIASHPEHFYAGAVLNPISELASQEIIHNILEKLSHDNPLAAVYDDRYVHLGNALQAIGRAKDAGLTPAKLKIEIEQHSKQLDDIEPIIVETLSHTLSSKNLPTLAESIEQIVVDHPSPLSEAIARLMQHAISADIPTGKTTQTGKIKAKLLTAKDGQKVMARERRANAWWSALVGVYEQYQTALYKRGYMDYSDMLIGVIEALEGDEDLRLDIQEATQYLLIDEFQDSNEAQIKLTHLLVDNPHIDAPNVMVVGDPNQTIYGFNGAMLDNTSDFRKHYEPSLTTIELLQNYRSSQKILDESRTVISPYSDFSPELIAQNEPTDTKVSYSTYLTEAHQAADIAQQAKRLLAKQPETSIAVLARGHASLSYIARRMSQEGLTVNYEQSIDLRTTSSNQLIINTLELIDAITKGSKQDAGHYFSLLLRHPALQLDPAEVWKVALAAKRNTSWIEAAGAQDSTSTIVDWVHSLVTVAASQTLYVLIEQILSSEFRPGKTLYQRFYKDNDDETMLVEAQSTRQLLELAKQYAQTERVSLTSFLSMLRSTDDKLFMFSPMTGSYQHAVSLMSVHGAKGLEFDHVFVVDADEGSWKPRASRYATPLSLPVHVNLETPSDYARLMYVAMTRARRSLRVSYVTRIDAKTKALPAEQLASKDFVEASPASAKQITLSEVAQLVPSRPSPKTMHELLGDTLSNYQLSATALTHFLDLSRQGMDTFIEEQLLRLPQPTSEVLAHGNAMHAAMELAQIQTSNNTFDLAAIKRLYSHTIAKEALTTTALERLTQRANAQLDTLFDRLRLKLDTSSQPEQSFNAVLNSGLSMYGKIDRIDTIDDRTICIIDYKTGKPITSPSSKSQDVLLKQWRHKLQLGFYVLLVKQQKRHADKYIKAQIVQLDATEATNLYLDYNFDNQELAHIERLAQVVFKRIKSLDIPDTSQFEPTITGIHEFESWLLGTDR